MKKSILAKLKKHRDAVAKERDSLRDALSEVEALFSCCVQGIVLLDEAIDTLSQQA